MARRQQFIARVAALLEDSDGATRALAARLLSEAGLV
jgi:hypothetical protein